VQAAGRGRGDRPRTGGVGEHAGELLDTDPPAADGHQRTGDAAWRTSASLMRVGSRSAFTSTLLITENCGTAMATLWM